MRRKMISIESECVIDKRSGRVFADLDSIVVALYDYAQENPAEVMTIKDICLMFTGLAADARRQLA